MEAGVSLRARWRKAEDQLSPARLGSRRSLRGKTIQRLDFTGNHDVFFLWRRDFCGRMWRKVEIMKQEIILKTSEELLS